MRLFSRTGFFCWYADMRSRRPKEVFTLIYGVGFSKIQYRAVKKQTRISPEV